MEDAVEKYALKPCKTVLIIEDDEDIRDTLAEMIRLERFEVRTAANGKEGLEILGAIERPCLILLDLMMPILNGWEFRELQIENAVLASIPVVVVSAATEGMENLKAEGYIKKPVEMEALMRTIRKYCD